MHQRTFNRYVPDILIHDSQKLEKIYLAKVVWVNKW